MTNDTRANRQRTSEHLHLPITHGHQHYHVSHHHKDGAFGEWEHRTAWHTHEHNHASLMHAHRRNQVREEAEHRMEAHLHDHAVPTGRAVRDFSDSEASLLVR